TAGPTLGETGTFIAGFSLGTMADATNWNVTGFVLEPSDCSCASFHTSFILLLDSSNDTLHGNSSSAYLDSFLRARDWRQTFIDGNTTTTPFTELDEGDRSNDRSGVSSYTLVAVVPPLVPEPPSVWLLITGLALTGLMAWWRVGKVAG